MGWTVCRQVVMFCMSFSGDDCGGKNVGKETLRVLKTSWIVICAVIALTFFLLLTAANLWMGDLNQDEGW